MVKIVVNRQIEREVYIFETLENILIGVEANFKTLSEPELRAGWKAQAVIGTILVAMLNEGWINAVGERVIHGWNERDGAEKKINYISRKLMGGASINARPLSTVHKIRLIRNEFAHGKPLIEHRVDDELIVDQQEDPTTIFDSLNHPVESEITPEIFQLFLSDSEKFRNDLLTASGLKRWDIRTRVHETNTYLRHLIDGSE